MFSQDHAYPTGAFLSDVLVLCASCGTRYYCRCICHKDAHRGERHILANISSTESTGFVGGPYHEGSRYYRGVPRIHTESACAHHSICLVIIYQHFNSRILVLHVHNLVISLNLDVLYSRMNQML